MHMLNVNYPRVIDCKHNTVNRNQNYRKDDRNSMGKLMKAYLYNNRLKYISKGNK